MCAKPGESALDSCYQASALINRLELVAQLYAATLADAAMEQRCGQGDDPLSAGAAALVRAAVVSFGFVYIHPMSDGNGRISRFLINDMLRRDHAIPAPFILPVSAAITSAVINRCGYDQVAYQDAPPAWRYPDMTDHVEYLAQVVQSTIEQEMRREATYLCSLRTARERVKQLIEGPDGDIDRIIRSVRENGDKVSKKLLKEMPALADEDLVAELVTVIHEAFAQR